MIHIVANNDHDLYMTQGAVVAVVSLIETLDALNLGKLWNFALYFFASVSYF